MHTNHRRKNKPPVDKTYVWRHRPGGLYTFKPWRRASWRKRRAQARQLMAHERYDELPDRYVDDIIWNYW